MLSAPLGVAISGSLCLVTSVPPPLYTLHSALYSSPDMESAQCIHYIQSSPSLNGGDLIQNSKLRGGGGGEAVKAVQCKLGVPGCWDDLT